MPYQIKLIVSGLYQTIELQAITENPPTQENWNEICGALNNITANWTKPPENNVCSGYNLQLSDGGVAQFFTKYTAPPMRK